jgi:hypothetical protein
MFVGEGFVIQLVFRYAGQLDAERVRDAFVATAREFEGVSGTLRRVDDVAMAIDVSTEARCRVVDRPTEAALSTCIEAVQTRVDEPLARAQITRLGDGGTAIGFAMSHTVADGYGYFLFLSAWASRVRGEDFLRPVCGRSLLDRGDGGVHRPIDTAGGAQILPYSGFTLVTAEMKAPELRVDERLTSPDQWKSSGQGFSASDFLSASLWKECTGDVAVGQTILACAVDIRIYREQLGPLFFGNAVLMAPVPLESGVLRSTPTADIARLIRASVAAVPARIDAARSKKRGSGQAARSAAAGLAREGDGAFDSLPDALGRDFV